jgi:hypothetical protein
MDEGPDPGPLTPAMLAVWHARPDLRAAFDITAARGRRDFRAWYEMQVAMPADRRAAAAWHGHGRGCRRGCGDARSR